MRKQLPGTTRGCWQEYAKNGERQGTYRGWTTYVIARTCYCGNGNKFVRYSAAFYKPDMPDKDSWVAASGLTRRNLYDARLAFKTEGAAIRWVEDKIDAKEAKAVERRERITKNELLSASKHEADRLKAKAERKADRDKKTKNVAEWWLRESK